MTRRDIIQRVVAGSVTLLVIPQILTSCSKDEDDPNPSGNPSGKDTITLDLNETANAALKSPGGSLVTNNILVMNLGGSFTALTSICTHQGCTVAYNSSVNIIQCPCHGSQYDTSGTVINGPAPRPLKSYVITKEGDILTIKL